MMGYLINFPMSKTLRDAPDAPLHAVPHKERVAAVAEIAPMLLRATGTRADLMRVLDGLFAEQSEPSSMVERDLSPEMRRNLLDYALREFKKAKKITKQVPTGWDRRKGATKEVAMIAENANWDELKSGLEAHPNLLWSLNEMFRRGHEPRLCRVSDEGYHFVTGSVSSAVGRNIAYDAEDQAACMERWPEKDCNGNALDSADELGVDLISKESYKHLLDFTRTDPESSNQRCWLKTDETTRREGMDISEHSVGHALSGCRGGGVIHIEKRDLGWTSPEQGWRGEFVVPRR